MDMVKSQVAAAQKGVSGNLAVSSVAQDTAEEAEKWKTEINDNDQKMFSGVFLVMVKADTAEELADYTSRIKQAGRKHVIEFEETYYHQEEALNSLLPIGKTYIDVKRRFMRDMTTTNIATQIPFTNTDLQSHSPLANYYGQNQISNNIITLDRQRDLETASGVILGSSGSGKSVFVKTNEIIPAILRFPNDRVIIVDPEEEYADIGRAFGAQIIDIYPGTKTHFNLMDIPNLDKLRKEDKDFVGQKSSLIMGLFENILQEVTDDDVSLIDRVTHLCYEQITDRTPTLKDWHDILLEQPEEEAQSLALKSESYTKGSQDIFAYETNVDLNNQVVIFNLKKLSGKLKPFALMVIQDYIWQHDVDHKDEFVTRVYFDEMQDAGTTISIKDGLGNQLTETEISKPFEALLFSSPELKTGETYYIEAGEQDIQMAVDGILNQYGTPSSGGFRRIPGGGEGKLKERPGAGTGEENFGRTQEGREGENAEGSREGRRKMQPEAGIADNIGSESESEGTGNVSGKASVVVIQETLLAGNLPEESLPEGIHVLGSSGSME